MGTITVVFNDQQSFQLQSHIFDDMLASYINRLYDRQKEQQAKLGALDIGSADRLDQFHLIVNQWVDANERIEWVMRLHKSFKETR